MGINKLQELYEKAFDELEALNFSFRIYQQEQANKGWEENQPIDMDENDINKNDIYNMDENDN